MGAKYTAFAHGQWVTGGRLGLARLTLSRSPPHLSREGLYLLSFPAPPGNANTTNEVSMDARKFLYWLNRLVPVSKRKARMIDSATIVRLMILAEKRKGEACQR